MSVVKDWRCTRCGVVIKGVRDTRGEIHATNRPYPDPAEEPGECICMGCRELPGAVLARISRARAKLERFERRARRDA